MPLFQSGHQRQREQNNSRTFIIWFDFPRPILHSVDRFIERDVFNMDEHQDATAEKTGDMSPTRDSKAAISSNQAEAQEVGLNMNGYMPDKALERSFSGNLIFIFFPC